MRYIHTYSHGKEGSPGVNTIAKHFSAAHLATYDNLYPFLLFFSTAISAQRHSTMRHFAFNELLTLQFETIL